MASSEENTKGQKIKRACNICRRRKIRCDGPNMPGKVCSTCLANHMSCTYKGTARRPSRSYIQSLENRIENMEVILRKLCLNGNFSRELDGALDPMSTVQSIDISPRAISSQDHLLPPPESQPIIPTPISFSDDDGYPSSDEDVSEDLKLSKRLFDKDPNPAVLRYVGKSADQEMVKRAIDMKNRFIGAPVHPNSSVVGKILARRPHYWQIPSWEKSTLNSRSDDRSRYIFPEPDLLRTLVDSYFTEVNTVYPLLHRPTLDRMVQDRIHFQEDGFARVLLTICAVASRFVDDSRILIDGFHSLSAGWKYFNQVQLTQMSLLSPSLYEIQLYCLSIIFLQGSSALQGCWSIIGIGIRLAQDIGAHRRKVYDSSPTAYNELWKRAFWVLVCLDREISTALGRPCVIQDEDFDLEMPIDCDDEFWECPDTEQTFRQPSGKPSRMSFFICFIKLQHIISFALRTIYSINSSKILLGFVGEEWERKTLAELNSALNKWVDSIPEHLQWDPERHDATFLKQSVMLYITYYMVQVMVYRPFIPNSDKKARLALPALAICTRAAKACSRVLNAQMKRRQGMLQRHFGAACMSGLVLLLKIWDSRRGGSVGTDKEMEDVYNCMNVLKQCEPKWYLAGRLLDYLQELALIKKLPVHSMPRSESASVLAKDNCPIRSEDSSHEGTDAGVSVAASSAPLSYSRSYEPNAEPHPRWASSTVIARSFPTCRPADPAATTPSGYGVSPSGSTVVSPDAPPESDWWNESTFAHALQQTPPAIDAVHPNFGLSPSTSASFNSLDTILGIPFEDPAFARVVTPEQTHISDDDMAAWLKAPAGWQSDDWDSWVLGMVETSQSVDLL